MSIKNPVIQKHIVNIFIRYTTRPLPALCTKIYNSLLAPLIGEIVFMKNHGTFGRIERKESEELYVVSIFIDNQPPLDKCTDKEKILSKDEKEVGLSKNVKENEIRSLGLKSNVFVQKEKNTDAENNQAESIVGNSVQKKGGEEGRIINNSSRYEKKEGLFHITNLERTDEITKQTIADYLSIITEPTPFGKILKGNVLSDIRAREENDRFLDSLFLRLKSKKRMPQVLPKKTNERPRESNQPLHKMEVKREETKRNDSTRSGLIRSESVQKKTKLLTESTGVIKVFPVKENKELLPQQKSSKPLPMMVINNNSNTGELIRFDQLQSQEVLELFEIYIFLNNFKTFIEIETIDFEELTKCFFDEKLFSSTIFFNILFKLLSIIVNEYKKEGEDELINYINEILENDLNYITKENVNKKNFSNNTLQKDTNGKQTVIKEISPPNSNKAHAGHVFNINTSGSIKQDDGKNFIDQSDPSFVKDNNMTTSNSNNVKTNDEKQIGNEQQKDSNLVQNGSIEIKFDDQNHSKENNSSSVKSSKIDRKVDEIQRGSFEVNNWFNMRINKNNYKKVITGFLIWANKENNEFLTNLIKSNCLDKPIFYLRIKQIKLLVDIVIQTTLFREYLDNLIKDIKEKEKEKSSSNALIRKKNNEFKTAQNDEQNQEIKNTISDAEKNIKSIEVWLLLNRTKAEIGEIGNLKIFFCKEIFVIEKTKLFKIKNEAFDPFLKKIKSFNTRESVQLIYTLKNLKLIKF